jgi:hypothetical protein
MQKIHAIYSAILLPLVAGCAVSPLSVPTTTITTQTSDGITIFGETYFGELEATAPLILLFHQGGSNGRSEYAPLVEQINNSGYRAIAWDQRSGGATFGWGNRTVQNLPEQVDTGFCDAQLDLQAALNFVVENEVADSVIIWGSSYSAALVFELASNNLDHVSGVIAFSPASGGPLEACRARKWAASIDKPMLVLRPSSEMERPSSVEQERILSAMGAEFLVIENGVHGSSMLVDERTNAPMEDAREQVFSWLSTLTQ